MHKTLNGCVKVCAGLWIVGGISSGLLLFINSLVQKVVVYTNLKHSKNTPFYPALFDGLALLKTILYTLSTPPITTTIYLNKLYY